MRITRFAEITWRIVWSAKDIQRYSRAAHGEQYADRYDCFKARAETAVSGTNAHVARLHAIDRCCMAHAYDIESPERSYSADRLMLAGAVCRRPSFAFAARVKIQGGERARS